MEMGGPMGMQQQWLGVVDWNAQDFDKLARRFDWLTTPITMEIILAQEDLWVYEAVLRVIKNTNEKATTPANAIVSRIESIDIGADAAQVFGQSEETVFHAAQVRRANVRRDGAVEPSRGSSRGQRAEQIIQGLMDWRYVDDQGKPLSATAEYPYASHPHKQFKMMPIHLSVTIDQRYLPKLLVECANSNMPIEIRRVAMLATADEPLDLKVGGGPGTPEGGPMMGDPGRGGRSHGGGGGGRAIRAAPRSGMRRGSSMPNQMSEPGMQGQQNPRPYDVPVDLFGVIYIYNPPEGGGQETASAEKPAGAAAGGENAASPAPPAGPTGPTPTGK